jgi:hypothetical protein
MLVCSRRSMSPLTPRVAGSGRSSSVSRHFRFGEGKAATWGRQLAELSRSPHRYVWPSELDLMVQLARFELESRHADWKGIECAAESRSHVPAVS